MIKLTPYENRNHFVETYVQDKFVKIQRRYNKMTEKDKEYLKCLFPEAFSGNMLDKKFFSDLLSLNLYEIIKKYACVKEYFEVAFFSSLDIRNICRDKSEKEAKSIREGYYCRFSTECKKFEKYIIPDYARKHSAIREIDKYICQSEERFEDFQNYIRKTIIGETRVRKNKIKYGVLKKLFNYKTMLEASDRNNIVKSLNLVVCPYCNRAYISSYEDNWLEDEERTTADLDHFFPKNMFVLFSISLYNFIPCCKVCNSLFKGDKNLDILYPYADAYEHQAKFSLVDNEKILEARDVYGWSKGKKIQIIGMDVEDSKRAAQIEREIQLFRIREVYQVHNEFAERLLYSKNVLGPRVKEEILECINKGVKDNQLQMEEFEQFFYGVDRDSITHEMKKTPLAKLIIDILN